MFDMNVLEYEQRKERPFPPEIVPFAPNHPDGVIWSCSTKTVIWIELTSPWEENMTLRHEEKHARYNQLKIDLGISCEILGLFAWVLFLITPTEHELYYA